MVANTVPAHRSIAESEGFQLLGGPELHGFNARCKFLSQVERFSSLPGGVEPRLVDRLIRLRPSKL